MLDATKLAHRKAKPLRRIGTRYPITPQRVVDYMFPPPRHVKTVPDPKMGSIDLAWNEPLRSWATYSVHRTETSGTSTIQIVNTTEPQHTDENLDGGQDYYYRFRTHYPVQNSQLSEEYSVFLGHRWDYIQGESANFEGLNQAGKGQVPYMMEMDSCLYAIWTEVGDHMKTVRLARFTGTNETPSWEFIDNGGLYRNAPHAEFAHTVVFNSEIYVAWSEHTDKYRIHVAVYKGNSHWEFVDGDEPQGGLNTGYNERFPQLAVFDSRLYATWESSCHGIREIQAAVYHEAESTWKTVTGEGFESLNRYSTTATENILSPQLVVNRDVLYMIWRQTHAGGDQQIRVAEYSGNDDMPSWNFVDGGEARDGINQGSEVRPAKMVSFEDSLYAIWTESGLVHVSRYNAHADTPAWTSANQSYSGNGLNWDPEQRAEGPNLTIYRNRLYAIWTEENGSGYQVRMAQYQPTANISTWRFVDNAAPGHETTEHKIGLNQDESMCADSPSLAAVNNHLYAIWQEGTDFNNSTIKVAAIS